MKYVRFPGNGKESKSVKTKIMAVLTLLLWLPALQVAVKADGRIHFSGATDGYLFAADGQQTATHLFGASPAIMAGETLTDELLIRHLPEGSWVLYLKCLKPEDAAAVFAGFQLEIRDSWDRVVFDGTMEKLTGWQFLGCFGQEDALLKLTLSVPDKLSAQSQKAWTKLEWGILAEEKRQDGSFSGIPKTGDTAMLFPAACAALISGAALMLAAGGALKKRRSLRS